MTIKILAFILYLPHIVLYFISSEKSAIFADLYSRTKKPANDKINLTDLSTRLFTDKYFRTLFYFRINHFISKILRIFYPKDSYFIIDINTILGEGVKLAHPYSTILNAESIGKNLYVNHLVTVGEKNGEKPKIGNDVELHAGCIVIGGVSIGDGAIIGAGAVVVRDVPSNFIAVGNPMRIFENKSKLNSSESV